MIQSKIDSKYIFRIASELFLESPASFERVHGYVGVKNFLKFSTVFVTMQCFHSKNKNCSYLDSDSANLST